MYVLIAKKQGGNEMQVSELIYNCTIFTRRGGLVVERRTPVRSSLRSPLFLQQNMFSHDAAQRNVCGIPNSEAGKFMYVLKRSCQQGAIQSVYISCYMA